MRIASRLLLANEQGGTLMQMTASPQQPLLLKTLSPIVVHTASLVLCKQKIEILLPFVNIFSNPVALAVSCHVLILYIHTTECQGNMYTVIPE